MYEYKDKSKQTATQTAIQPKSKISKTHTLVDNRPISLGGQALQRMIKGIVQNNLLQDTSTPIQRAAETVTLTGAKNAEKKFQQCYQNSVSYNAGETRVEGTSTTTPAAWDGWVIDNERGNNATQLHVVSQKFGGPGGQEEGNIAPGSQRLNNPNHLALEREFKNEVFPTGNKAAKDATYTCSVKQDYGNSVDVSSGDVVVKDPDITVSTVIDGKSDSKSVTKGQGMTLKDPNRGN